MAVATVTMRNVRLTMMRAGRSKLTAGAVSVSLKEITEESLVFLSGDDANVDGALQCVITEGTGFAIASSEAGDAGYVAWLVIVNTSASS
jgi:hypothetical protein